MAEIGRVTNGGERVIHLYRNDCFYAHLAVYRFALNWCRGKDIIDAGCGTGYGCDYLIRNGAASVLGLDSAPEAVETCRKYFHQAGLEFQQLDLRQIHKLTERTFDVLYSSNTLEHIPGVDGFFSAARSLLRPGGSLIIAVPPIISEEALLEERKNPHHVNLWSPEQWLQAINRYFQTVRGYRHAFKWNDVQLDFAGIPDDCKISELDFDFPPCQSIDDMRNLGTISAIFVAVRGDGA